MSEKRPQTLANHAKIVPTYHFVALGLIVVALLWAAWKLIQNPSLNALISVLFIVAMAIIAFYARVFALQVQDRLIRLEERLRMATLLPEDLLGRVDELSVHQMVALRFASDAELAGLVREVLDQNLSDRKTIKQKIRDWRPDYDRC